MKFLALIAFIAVALATPQGEKKPIFSNINMVAGRGGYGGYGGYGGNVYPYATSYGYESADGTKISESDSQKQLGPKPEDIGIVSRGSYSFTTPDDVVLTVNWVTYENGFHATGDHLPTPPPMPEH